MEHELLKNLSAAEAEQVLALGTRLTLASGATLFRMGDNADSLYLIVRGRMRLTLPMPVLGQEQEILIEERTPGQTVGWSVLVPPYRFTLSATAPLETEVIVLPRDALRKFCETSPEIGYKLVANLAMVVANRLQMVQAMWLREMQHIVDLKSGAIAGA